MYLEQCRSVNPFLCTGVFNQFKLTYREFSVACNGSDIYPFTESLIRHFFIHYLLCVYVESFLYMGARSYWAN